MSKLSIGMVAAGAVLASAVAVSVVAANSDSDTSGHDVALPTSVSAEVGSGADGTDVGGAGKAQAVTDTAARAAAKAAAQKQAGMKASTVKPVRAIKLQLPTTATNVGTNVTGMIVVTDTAAKVVSPAVGANVAFQQLRGKTYVTVADGQTDESGFYPVAFTSKTNSSWRAVLTSDTGKKTYSPVVATKASAQVTWASRPDMDVTKGKANSYSFRINSETPVATGHLEIANSKTPNKWVALKNVPVSGAGVVVQSQKFPTAGTWLLRGATAGNATNAAGYTTTLTVEVS